MEGNHSVHLLLIFGEAVENTAGWRCVEETHGAGDNLWRFVNMIASS